MHPSCKVSTERTQFAFLVERQVPYLETHAIGQAGNVLLDATDGLKGMQEEFPGARRTVEVRQRIIGSLALHSRAVAWLSPSETGRNITTGHNTEAKSASVHSDFLLLILVPFESSYDADSNHISFIHCRLIYVKQEATPNF